METASGLSVQSIKICLDNLYQPSHWVTKSRKRLWWVSRHLLIACCNCVFCWREDLENLYWPAGVGFCRLWDPERVLWPFAPFLGALDDQWLKNITVKSVTLKARTMKKYQVRNALMSFCNFLLSAVASSSFLWLGVLVVVAGLLGALSFVSLKPAVMSATWLSKASPKAFREGPAFTVPRAEVRFPALETSEPQMNVTRKVVYL